MDISKRATSRPDLSMTHDVAHQELPDGTTEALERPASTTMRGNTRLMPLAKKAEKQCPNVKFV